MELVQLCAVLRASSFQRTITCIQSGNNFYSLISNREQKLTDSRMPLWAAFFPWGFFKWSSVKARHIVLHSSGEDLETLPSFFWILVCKGQNVRCSPTAITDHNWERGFFPQTLQDNGDYIGTSFHYEPNHRNTLPQSCKNQKNRNEKKKKEASLTLSLRIWDEWMWCVLEHCFQPEPLGKMMAIWWLMWAKHPYAVPQVQKKRIKMSLCPCFCISSILITYPLSAGGCL